MARDVRIIDKVTRDKLGRELKKYRKEFGINREKMSGILDISLETLDNIENLSTISVTNALKIIAKLNWDPRRFLDQK